MNTEQFIRDSAARGFSRRATRLALGLGPWVFREMLSLMPDIEWPARGRSVDHMRANSAKRGQCSQALAEALAAARKAHRDRLTHTVGEHTGTIEDLVKLLPSPVSASTVRRRVAEGMNLEQALTTPPLPSRVSRPSGARICRQS
ncbi:hypothetical protein N5J43_08220 [Pseudomonas nicosulfuronedens]|uniref:hypothetical protein n=1 Tax=Pseudomonas nicosulfuronedens TaxID=2571105 RepID=UPI002446BC9A|nr:hypothetical protein [Pseudomonas nicosulfuronedens]MDH1009958.1 hypothetical protein [Pseudomonas nicosulfuronedens]MDH1978934.1 hypothetical protein [Pseudomonas nicosulfuronedens]MDH2028387.1 hypothetical protein [Pseudomonas nicosulfuronedens]